MTMLLRCIKLFLVSMVVSSVTLAQHNPTPQVSRNYLSIENYYNNENWDQCLAMEKDINDEYAGKIDTMAANAFFYLGDSYYYKGELDKALDYYRMDLNIRGQVFGKGSEAYGESLSSVAYTEIEAGQYTGAKKHLEELTPLDAKYFGKGSEEYVATATNLGKVYLLENDFNEAEDLYKDLLKEVSKEDMNYPVILGDLANIHIYRGEYTQAKKMLAKALDIIALNQGKESLNYSSLLYNLSTLYYFKGQYAESELMNRESIKILSKLGIEDNLQAYTGNINQLGVTYTYLGLLEEAEQYLNELAGIELVRYGENHPQYALILNNLANLKYFQKKYKEAEELYIQSRDINKNHFGTKSLEYAISLNNLAYLYKKTGKYDYAIALYERSAEIYKDKYGENHPGYANVIHNLGDAWRYSGNIQEAEKFLDEAEKTRARTIGKDHPRYAETLNSMAILSWEKKDASTQRIFNDLFTNYFNQVDRFFTVMSEEEKATFFNNRLRTGFEQYNSFVLGNIEKTPSLIGEMYNYVLSTKGLIMYSTQKVRKSILNSGNQELIEKYNTWINNKEQLSKLYSQSQENIEKSQATIDSLTGLTDRVEKELSLESDVFGKDKKKEVVTWQDIQQNLGKDEAVVELVRIREFNPSSGGSYTGEIRYAALILTAKTKKVPELVVIEDGKGIEKRFLSVYRNSIRFKMDDPHSYDYFWKGIDNKLRGIKQVYFSPDGVFNQISINTLYDNTKKEYLIDRYNITQVTNSRDVYLLKTGQIRAPSDGKTYLFGFPNYNMGMEERKEQQKDEESIERSINRGLRGMDRSLRGSLRSLIRGNNLLQMLPGTKVEVENISSEFKDSENKPIMYIENDALEEYVKEVKDPKTLHIATHGFFLADQHLPESGDENLYYDNPLLRSGLIMAGVNNFLTQDDDLVSLIYDDGILTAYEAMNMDLDDTDMIVLSACETGLGTISNGEGVYGLQRAFQIAGAKSLIISLWSVDDDATQELMSSFYKNWLETGDKLGAFRTAQFQIKEKYKDPFYWGAFVLVGM